LKAVEQNAQELKIPVPTPNRPPLIRKGVGGYGGGEEGSNDRGKKPAAKIYPERARDYETKAVKSTVLVPNRTTGRKKKRSRGGGHMRKADLVISQVVGGREEEGCPAEGREKTRRSLHGIEYSTRKGTQDRDNKPEKTCVHA